mmetsp:Transcript_23361/g.55485  ORF Transcript_23361/g.55485 Transcript_23361/m.55485 type:complete len:223 (+) Transcript_23361:7969-8637(+)
MTVSSEGGISNIRPRCGADHLINGPARAEGAGPGLRPGPLRHQSASGLPVGSGVAKHALLRTPQGPAARVATTHAGIGQHARALGLPAAARAVAPRGLAVGAEPVLSHLRRGATATALQAAQEAQDGRAAPTAHVAHRAGPSLVDGLRGRGVQPWRQVPHPDRGRRVHARGIGRACWASAQGRARRRCAQPIGPASRRSQSHLRGQRQRVHRATDGHVGLPP